MKRKILQLLSITLISFFIQHESNALSFGSSDITEPWSDYWGDAIKTFVDTGLVDENDLEDYSDIFPSPDVEGVDAKLYVMPKALFFGTWPKGVRSIKLPVVVTNDGTLPLTIYDLKLEGDHPEDFKIEDDECEGETLSNLDTCTIRISFKPKDMGTRKAKLRIKYAKAKVSPPFGQFKSEYVKLLGIGIPTNPGDFLDNCNFDDLWKGKCGDITDIGDIGDVFKFSKTEDPEVIKAQSVEPDAGGCSMAVSPSILPLYLLVPALIYLRRKINR